MLGEAVDPCLQSWYRWLSWLFVRGVGVFFWCWVCGMPGVWRAWHGDMHALTVRLFGCLAISISGFLGDLSLMY